MQWLQRKSPCFHPFVTRDHNRGTAYLGEGWPFWFRRVACRTNVRMCQAQASSGDPEQPVSIQHIEGVLVGARKGQRADIQWILKWLKPSNVWCSCSSWFRCVQIVTFLHTFCYITQALKHFIVFLCKIVYLSFRCLYGTVFHPDIDFAKWKFKRSNNGGGRIPEKYLMIANEMGT